MKKEIKISGLRLPVNSEDGFTLVEVMVVVTLLSLIVLALMAVFNTTQAAFRASVTQSDVLEGGRAAMDVIASDLKEMAPSLGSGNSNVVNRAVNFYAEIPSGYTAANNEPLLQSLVATSNNQLRTNVLEDIFILSRENQTWTGIGYRVDFTNSSHYINALYRFEVSANIHAADPWTLYNNFLTNSTANMSHLIDGVVHLRVHAFGLGTNSAVMTRDLKANTDIRLSGFVPGEVGLYKFYSNALPAAVEVEMGVLEDRTLQRAESIPNLATQSNYLAQQAGKVHIFRQHVSIPNVDPAAYQ